MTGLQSQQLKTANTLFWEPFFWKTSQTAMTEYVKWPNKLYPTEIISIYKWQMWLKSENCTYWFVDHLIVVVVAWFTSHNSKKTLLLLGILLSDKMTLMIQKPIGNCQWQCYWSMLNHCLVLLMQAKCDGYNYLCTIVVPIVWRDCYNYFSIIN